jgi:hypothetical protein
MHPQMRSACLHLRILQGKLPSDSSLISHCSILANCNPLHQLCCPLHTTGRYVPQDFRPSTQPQSRPCPIHTAPNLPPITFHKHEKAGYENHAVVVRLSGTVMGTGMYRWAFRVFKSSSKTTRANGELELKLHALILALV